MRRRVSRWAIVLSALGFGAWWILSVVFHVALLSVFYVATPPDAEVSTSSDFAMKISPDRVREVVQEIRDQEADRFKEKVEDLLQIKQELDQLNADKIAQYNQIIKEEGVRARDKLTPAAARVLAAQKEALAAQESAQKALVEFKASHEKAASSTTPWDAKIAQATAEAAMKVALVAQENASNAQHEAEVAQEEIASQLRLTNTSPEAIAAHQTAATAQGNATGAQGTAVATIKKIAEVKRALTAAEEAAARQRTALGQVNTQMATAQAGLAPRQQALGVARQNFENARTEAAANAAAAKAATKEEKKRLAELAKQSAATVKKEQVALAKAEQDLRQVQIVAKRVQDAAARQQQKTDEALAVLQKRQEAVTTTVSAAVNDSVNQQQDSTSAQQNSLALQEAANAAIAKALAESKADNTTPAMAAAQPSVLPTADPASAKNLADLYKQAQDAEVAVAETFKNVRAAELASIRKIPLSEALEMTKVAKPDRPELDTAILKQDIADVKGVREQEKIITAAAEQMDSMVALAQRMRELAAAAGADLSIAEIRAQSDRNERMEQLAMEDAGAKAKDLSGEMAAADHGGVHGGSGGGAPAPLLGPAAEQAGGGAQGQSGNGAGVASVEVKDYRPIHGRTVRQGMVDIEHGRNPAWMYVDTWHLIGPWPNPGRKNLNTKFPPETVVNLDAIYQGGRKNDVPMPVRWEFFQMPSKVTGKDRTPMVPMIMPPGLADYEIYYAYTELWFDEPADLWVAIGSDDQSKVWINDQLIWKSADYHKTWVPNEGLRKVHFRKGINRLLYRLENGQNSGGFSFLVCLSEGQAAGR
ncbi:MAG: hypothetical protein WC661_10665 [Opitutaceae bacterium]|jgi:hypothetical protein